MKKRILIVDDEINVVKILKDRFVHLEYEVETASDGQQALEKVADFSPHLIILDIRMPKISGLEILGRVKTTYPHIRILVITASQKDDTHTACMEKGADGFILKPFKTREIIEKVENIIKTNVPVNTHE
jgi:DNA-binding response OmpR family regulator